MRLWPRSCCMSTMTSTTFSCAMRGEKPACKCIEMNVYLLFKKKFIFIHRKLVWTQSLMFVSASGMRGLGLGGPQPRVSTMGWVSSYYSAGSKRLNIYITAHGFSLSNICTSQCQLRGFACRCYRQAFKCLASAVICPKRWFTQCTCLNKWKLIKEGDTVMIKTKQIFLLLCYLFTKFSKISVVFL